MTLRYSVGGAAAISVAMNHQGNGRYTGTIPGQAAASIVQFYVEGADALGAASFFPAAGRGFAALYQVQDNPVQGRWKAQSADHPDRGRHGVHA